MRWGQEAGGGGGDGTNADGGCRAAGRGGRNGRSDAGGRPPKYSTGAPSDRPTERTNSRTPSSPSLSLRTPDLGLYCTNFCPRSLNRQSPIRFGRFSVLELHRTWRRNNQHRICCNGKRGDGYDAEPIDQPEGSAPRKRKCFLVKTM